MDAVILARIQFALTVGFHFIFPPISIGLAWLLVIFEYLGWKKNSELYYSIGKFFGKILALTFAMGVATGIVMEFQFGTNWSEYSRFVGDIFGAPLAAEGVFAFFLESGFLGLYLFGRNKVSKPIHWFAILMVAIGSTMSAFWILVANSWQQTPAGYVLQNGRAELVSFYEAVFNPSMLIRFFHTFTAAIISGAFVVAGVASYYLLKKRDLDFAKASMRIAVIVALVSSLLELFPFGHEHVKQVANTQPEKFAAIEGLYTSDDGNPLVLFALPFDDPPELKAKIEIPGLVGWLAFGDPNAKIKTIADFPRDEVPPLFLTFVSFHNMVILGMFFIGLSVLATYLMWKKKLYENKWVLRGFFYGMPLPVIACQLGWITAEVGRQPWIVYRLLKTSDAVSVSVPAYQILISIIMFVIIYALLGSLYVYIFRKKVLHGPEKLSMEAK